MLQIYLNLIDSHEESNNFTLLYEKYRRLMFYIANDILQDEALSEDALQESFLRVAKNFHKVGDINSPQTRNFLVIITKNVSLTMLSSRKKNLSLEEEIFLDNPSATEDIIEQFSEDLLSQCILKLTEDYRYPLYLYHFYGYSIKETANLLGISVETAKKRIQRARYMLKEFLIEEGFRNE